MVFPKVLNWLLVFTPPPSKAHMKILKCNTINEANYTKGMVTAWEARFIFSVLGPNVKSENTLFIG